MNQEPNESTRSYEEAMKVCFDGCKHMSTLSTAATAILIAGYQEKVIDNGLLTVALAGLSLSILASLVGLLVPAKSQINRGDGDLPLTFVSFYFSIFLFAGGTLTAVVGSLGLPDWVEFATGWIVGAILVLVIIPLFLSDAVKRER